MCINCKIRAMDHFKVICISLYNEDIERLDNVVDELKQRGFRATSRSAVIRYALDMVDMKDFDKGWIRKTKSKTKKAS